MTSEVPKKTFNAWHKLLENLPVRKKGLSKIYGKVDKRGRRIGLHFIVYIAANKPREEQNIRRVESYRNGVRHGIFSQYNDRFLWRQDLWVNGNLVSVNIFGPENQAPKDTASFKNGKLHGAFLIEDTEEGSYKNGKRSGPWKFFEDKELVETVYYREGKVHGLVTMYSHLQIVPRCRVTVRDGVPHGWAHYWGTHGDFLGKQKFIRGLCVLKVLAKNAHLHEQSKLHSQRLWSEASEALVLAERDHYNISRRGRLARTGFGLGGPHYIRETLNKAIRIERNYFNINCGSALISPALHSNN